MFLKHPPEFGHHSAWRCRTISRYRSGYKFKHDLFPSFFSYQWFPTCFGWTFDIIHLDNGHWDLTRHHSTLRVEVPSLKRKGHHIEDFFIAGCIRGCHHDNLWCSQWWRNRQHDDLSVSVHRIHPIVFVLLCFVVVYYWLFLTKFFGINLQSLGQS